MKKACKAGLLNGEAARKSAPAKSALARDLFRLAEQAQARGWSAEELLRTETKKRERGLRQQERKQARQRKQSNSASKAANKSTGT